MRFPRSSAKRPSTIDELTELVSNGFVADSNGRIVGFAALEVYSAKLAEVRSLVVSPETQGQGVGRRLLAACVDKAHSLNRWIASPRPIDGAA